MKVYKVKHKASGLFYSKRRPHLSKKGSTYLTKNTVLTQWDYCDLSTRHQKEEFELVEIEK